MRYTFLYQKPAAAGFSDTRRNDNMEKNVCDMCGYVYDSTLGDPDNGIKPGTLFKDIPDTWVCPMCGVPKDKFYSVMVS